MDTGKNNSWTHLDIMLGRILTLGVGLLGGGVLYIAYLLQGTESGSEAAIVSGILLGLSASMYYWRTSFLNFLGSIVGMVSSDR